MAITLTFVVLPGSFAICWLGPAATVPAWAQHGSFTSVTRTPDELSIVCAREAVPEALAAPWRQQR